VDNLARRMFAPCLFIACLSAAALGFAQQRGGAARITIYQEPETLHPLFGSQSVNNVVEEPIIEGLLTVNPEGEYVPVLAAEVPSLENGGLSEDGLTVTYRLKEGVTWSDGEPLTSADVKFTFDAIMDESNPVTSTDGYDKMVSVETPDEHTVVVTYDEYDVEWQSRFSSVLPAHVFEGETANMAFHPFSRNPLGTGPFRFVEWVSGSRIVLERNPNYREEGKPYLDRLVFQIVPSPEVAAAQLQAGETDMIWNVRESQIPELLEMPGVVVDFGEERTSTERIQLNLRNPENLSEPHPILSDKRVRQALQYATPKQQIIDGLIEGGRAFLACAHVDIGWAADPECEPSEYDPERAAQLLEEAGWEMGPDGIRVKDGQRLELTISSTAEKQRELTEQLLQSLWRQIGIDLRIRNHQSSVLFGTYDEGGVRGTGNFDLLMYAASDGLDPHGHYVERFTCEGAAGPENPGGYNFSGYCNPEVDRLIEQAGTEVDLEARADLYIQASRIIQDDVESILLYNRSEVNAYSERLKGVAGHPWANLAWNAEEWYIEG